MFKFFAKLVGLEGWPKAKPEIAEEKFRREQQRESELAGERRQANPRRMAERNQGEKDVTEEMEKFTNENNQG